MKSPGESGSVLVREGTDAAAAGVAEHDDVLHPQRLHGEFEGRGRAVLESPSGLIGRHEVGDVAHNEQFAGRGVEDDLGRHAEIAAADHHDFRALAQFGHIS